MYMHIVIDVYTEIVSSISVRCHCTSKCHLFYLFGKPGFKVYTNTLIIS